MSYLLNQTLSLINRTSFLINRTSHLVNQTSYLLNRTSSLVNRTSYLIFLYFYSSTVFICKYTYVPNGTSYWFTFTYGCNNRICIGLWSRKTTPLSFSKSWCNVSENRLWVYIIWRRGHIHNGEPVAVFRQRNVFFIW